MGMTAGTAAPVGGCGSWPRRIATAPPSWWTAPWRRARGACAPCWCRSSGLAPPPPPRRWWWPSPGRSRCSVTRCTTPPTRSPRYRWRSPSCSAGGRPPAATRTGTAGPRTSRAWSWWWPSRSRPRPPPSATSWWPATASVPAARSARRPWSPTGCTPAPTASPHWRCWAGPAAWRSASTSPTRSSGSASRWRSWRCCVMPPARSTGGSWTPSTRTWSTGSRRCCGGRRACARPAACGCAGSVTSCGRSARWWWTATSPSRAGTRSSRRPSIASCTSCHGWPPPWCMRTRSPTPARTRMS